jgi:hypothetical protein
MPEPKLADETPPRVDDHAFHAPFGKPWGLCAELGCGLAESAHAETRTPYSEHLRRTYGPRDS